MCGTWYLKFQVPLVQKDFKELNFVKIEFHVAFFNGERNISSVHRGKNHTKLNYLKIEFYTKLEFQNKDIPLNNLKTEANC